ncbi:MAG: LysM peptidoglycan-binding domain-containing protein [Chloroflexi bacterium]|nr:LysM peptidoglycan-binding domain-containing protein [Chloroflexota bacterium]
MIKNRYVVILSLMATVGLLGMVSNSLAGQPEPGSYGRYTWAQGPSPTLPPTITPTLSPTPGPPPSTPLPTNTPGPFVHRVAEGETCISIALNYGHNDLAVLGAIEDLNSIRCSALSPGAELQIPRPTATPTQVGADLTQTAVATSAPPMLLATMSGPQFAVETYEIQAGDTLLGLSFEFDTSMRLLCEINPLPEGLDCSGCVLEGDNFYCPRPPTLSIGQQINVPAPPPPPTVTPTLTGNETSTPTPTHRPPEPVYPPHNSSVAGPVRLTWVTVGLLDEGEYYLVSLQDQTTGTSFDTITRQLSVDLPDAYLPADGQAHVFVWQVAVVRVAGDGLLHPISPVTASQTFTWRGWEGGQ